MLTAIKKYGQKGLIYIIVFFVIMLGANWWKTRHATSGNLSEYSGQLIDGNSFNIATYAGKPVLIHFWATWCPICQLSNSNIQSISKDYPVITIASWSEGKAHVVQYLQTHQLDFKVMLDESGAVAKQFGLKGVPTSFILDKKGNIRFVETGYSSEIGLRFRLWLATQNQIFP